MKYFLAPFFRCCSDLEYENPIARFDSQFAIVGLDVDHFAKLHLLAIVRSAKNQFTRFEQNSSCVTCFSGMHSSRHFISHGSPPPATPRKKTGKQFDKKL